MKTHKEQISEILRVLLKEIEGSEDEDYYTDGEEDFKLNQSLKEKKQFLESEEKDLGFLQVIIKCMRCEKCRININVRIEKKQKSITDLKEAIKLGEGK